MVRVLQLEVVGGMGAAGSPCTHKNSASNLDTEVFDLPESLCKYALDALRTGERLTGELAVEGRLHLWPDMALGSKSAPPQSMPRHSDNRTTLDRSPKRVVSTHIL